VHLYPVGTELKVIGHEQGWFNVLDPATSRTGWIYEKYYLDAIPGPGQVQFAMHQLANPAKVALAGPKPRLLNRIQKSKPKQKVTKPKGQQRMQLASAGQTESVASIMERAFGRN
jgi:hypothetical protein